MDNYFRKRITKEEFLKLMDELKISERYKLVGEYTYKNTPTLFYCKIHDIDFITTPKYILMGNCSCPKCKHEKSGKNRRKTTEQFKKELKEISPNIEIISEYKGTENKIWCRCENGHEWEAFPNNLLKGNGCPYCINKKIIPEENSLWALKPELRKFIHKDWIEFAKNVATGSDKKIKLICPDCGTEKIMGVETFVTQGFSCPICSSNISFPNRLLRKLLEKQDFDDIKYEYKVTINGVNYFYDASFYYQDKHYFVEMDGDYHLDNRLFKFFDQQKRDKIKNKYAEENDIELIRINSKYDPKRKIIIENLKNSKLFDLLTNKNINFEELIEEAESTNELKEITKLIRLNKGKFTRVEFGILIGKTDKNYLRNKINLGIKLGWCDKNSFAYSQGKAKYLKGYKDEKYLGIFRSLSDFAIFIQKNFEQDKKVNSLKHYFYPDRDSHGYSYKEITKEEYFEYLKSIFITD